MPFHQKLRSQQISNEYAVNTYVGKLLNKQKNILINSITNAPSSVLAKLIKLDRCFNGRFASKIRFTNVNSISTVTSWKSIYLSFSFVTFGTCFKKYTTHQSCSGPLQFFDFFVRSFVRLVQNCHACSFVNIKYKGYGNGVIAFI